MCILRWNEEIIFGFLIYFSVGKMAMAFRNYHVK